VLHGLKQGNEVLKEIHKEMNIESVERLLEETAEAQEYQRVCFKFLAFNFDIINLSLIKEIGDMLSNTLNLDDEEAVQQELLSLQQEVVSVPYTITYFKHNLFVFKAAETAKDVELPSVPSEQPVHEETERAGAQGKQQRLIPHSKL